MNKLNKAILTRFNSSNGATLRVLVVGGLWTVKAPAETKLPLVRFDVLPTGTESSTMSSSGVQYIESVIGQFTIFVADYQMDLGWQIRDELIKLYDNHYPAFGSGEGKVYLAIRQDGGRRMEDPDGGFDIIIAYRYKFREVIA